MCRAQPAPCRDITAASVRRIVAPVMLAIHVNNDALIVIIINLLNKTAHSFIIIYESML